MTKFYYVDLNTIHQARGVIIAIDVLRAFTTAAYAFEAGADRIYPVSTVEEALHLKQKINGALTLGEVDGFQPPAFDFSNSPAEISRANIRGKVLIHRSSAGTQGLTQAAQASPDSPLLAASFVVARATAKYLMAINPDWVTFVVTGADRGRDGDEDRACGEYIEALVNGGDPDPVPYTRRVAASTVGRGFQQGGMAYILKEDFDLSVQTNRFSFCLPVLRDEGRLVMVKKFQGVSSFGNQAQI